MAGTSMGGGSGEPPIPEVPRLEEEPVAARECPPGSPAWTGVGRTRVRADPGGRALEVRFDGVPWLRVEPAVHGDPRPAVVREGIARGEWHSPSPRGDADEVGARWAIGGRGEAILAEFAHPPLLRFPGHDPIHFPEGPDGNRLEGSLSSGSGVHLQIGGGRFRLPPGASSGREVRILPESSGEPIRILVRLRDPSRPLRSGSGGSPPLAGVFLRPVTDLRHALREGMSVRTGDAEVDRTLERWVGEVAVRDPLPGSGADALPWIGLARIAWGLEDLERDRPDRTADPSVLLLARERRSGRSGTGGPTLPRLLERIVRLLPDGGQEAGTPPLSLPERVELRWALDAVEPDLGRGWTDLRRQRLSTLPVGSSRAPELLRSARGARLPMLGGSAAPDRSEPLESLWLRRYEHPGRAIPPRSLPRPDGAREWALLGGILFSSGDPEGGWGALRRAILLRNQAPGDPGGGEDEAVAPIVMLAIAEGRIGIEAEPLWGRIRLAPSLLPGADRLEVRRIPAGDGAIHLDCRSDPGGHSFEIEPAAGRVPLHLIFQPTFPGTGGVRCSLGEEALDLEVREAGLRSGVEVQFPLEGRRVLRIEPTTG